MKSAAVFSFVRGKSAFLRQTEIAALFYRSGGEEAFYILGGFLR